MNDETQTAARTAITKGDVANQNHDKVFANGFAADRPQTPRPPEPPSQAVQIIPPRPSYGINQEVMDACKVMAGDSPFTPQWLVGNVTSAWNIIELAQHFMTFDQRTNSWRMMFSPMQLAQNVYVVESGGKRSIGWTSALIGAVMDVSLTLSEPMDFTYAGEGQDRTCTVTGVLAGSTKKLVYTTPKLSAISPKRSPLWQTDPDQQLAYYARRSWTRRHRPSILLGMHDVDELPDGRVIDHDPSEGAAQAMHERLRASAGDPPGNGFKPGVVEAGLGEGGPDRAEKAKDAPKAKSRAKAAPKAGKRTSAPESAGTEQVREAEAELAGEAAAEAKAEAARIKVADAEAEPAAKTAKAEPLKLNAPENAEEYEEHLRLWLTKYDTEESIMDVWKRESALRQLCGISAISPIRKALWAKHVEPRLIEIRAAS